MQSLSLLYFFIAWNWALVRLGSWGWEDLRTLLISALSSSASCWPNLVHTDSMAVMHSMLEGCLGDTTELGPLASIDLSAWAKGLLNKLITHFRLGSSSVLPLFLIWFNLMLTGTKPLLIHGLARNIKESIFIRVNDPTLNRNIGRFNLCHIWDKVLLNTPCLNLKRHVQAVWLANSNTPHLTQPDSPTQFCTGLEYAHRTS